MRRNVQRKQANRPSEELDTLEGGIMSAREATNVMTEATIPTTEPGVASEATAADIRTEASTEAEPAKAVQTWAWSLGGYSHKLFLVPPRTEKERGKPLLDM